MKAKVTIDPIVESAFTREGVTPRTFTQVVADIIPNLLDKTRVRPYADKLILAGNERDGFVDIDRTRLEGILPYVSGTSYNYGEGNSIFEAIAKGYKGEFMIIAAIDGEIADRCQGVLDKLGYNTERI